MRTSNRLSGVALLVLAAVAATGSPAQAQDGDQEWKVPHKNGHTFSSFSSIPHAFVRSYLQSNLGVSNTFDVDIPLGIIDGDTLFASRGSLLFANLALAYQQTIRDWIAFRAHFRILGRLGTGTSALLSTGISASTGFEFGWLFRLLETDRGYLSGDVFAKNTDFTTINISEFVDDIVEGRDAELTRNTPSMRAGVGLRYTHAFSPLIGGVGFFETGYGESVDRREDQNDEWFTRFGLSVDFDLGAVGWLPVGLAVGYNQDSFPEGGADITDVTRSVLFRVGYTGRKDLVLGLNVAYTTFPTEDLDQKIKSLGINFTMGYYF